MNNKKIQKQKILIQIKNRNISDKAKFISADLSKMKFNGMDFSNIDFSKSNFKKAEFVKCIFKGTVLKAANLEYAGFIECMFKDVDFQFSDINYGRFENCIMDRVDLRDCKLEESLFSNNKIQEVLFEGAFFNYSKIKKCEFKKIKSRKSAFEGVEIRENVFIDADFTASDFRGALLSKNVFENTLFTSVIAYGLEISKSTFKDMDFFNADFKEAHIPKDVREEIVKQDGIITPPYFKLMWKNKYARACIIWVSLFIIFGIIENIMNPACWGLDKLINGAYKAVNRNRNFKEAKNILKIGLNRRNITEYEKVRLEIALAEILKIEGKSEEAKGLIEEGLKLARDKGQRCKLLLNKGDILRDEGDKKGAMNIYKKAKGIGGQEWYIWDAMAMIAWMYRDEGKVEEAIRECKELIESIGMRDIDRKAGISLELGDLYRDMGNKEEAKRIYEEIKELSLNNQNLVNEINKRLER